MALVQVDITVTDDDVDETPLPDVRYTVMDAGQTGVLFSGVSSPVGVIGPLALEEATDYALLLSKPFTTFTVPVTLSVAAGPAPQSVSVQGAFEGVNPPAGPNLCRVYGFLTDLKGDEAAGINVYFRNDFAKLTGADGRVAASDRLDVVTDDNGQFLIDLVQGLRIRVSIEGTALAAHFIVPEQATANLADLLGAAVDDIDSVVFG